MVRCVPDICLRAEGGRCDQLAHLGRQPVGCGLVSDISMKVGGGLLQTLEHFRPRGDYIGPLGKYIAAGGDRPGEDGLRAHVRIILASVFPNHSRLPPA